RNLAAADVHDLPIVRAQLVEVLRPLLHHLPAQRQMIGRVIACADLVARHVRKLPLDRVLVPLLLIEQRARRAAEAVRGVLVLREPERAERGVQCVLTQRARGVSRAGEYESFAVGASKWLELAQY